MFAARPADGKWRAAPPPRGAPTITPTATPTAPPTRPATPEVRSLVATAAGEEPAHRLTPTVKREGATQRDDSRPLVTATAWAAFWTQSRTTPASPTPPPEPCHASTIL